MKSIVLTMGQVALVDDDDYEWLSQWKWQAMRVKGGGFYACRAHRPTKSRRDDKRVLMHRQIMDAADSVEVDHASLNKLDNRRQNLRVCTRSQNNWNLPVASHNTSGYKGVSWYSRRGVWEAYIGTHGRREKLGYFKSKVSAAIAYNIAAVQLHGEFARLNDVFSGEVA